ncbi:hypothetical protein CAUPRSCDRAFT_11389 [Caulochytrium protostelioides]|uniref:Uncharacterized protein n=1 Tax=Caulochytrium protostelioides TaxID=1555241 RepID=A0A4P9WZV5_9FUNG|nr:hypothetical protein CAUPRSCDRAFT_11389 [Caulochytrium protostelioides]
MSEGRWDLAELLYALPEGQYVRTRRKEAPSSAIEGSTVENSRGGGRRFRQEVADTKLLRIGSLICRRGASLAAVPTLRGLMTTAAVAYRANLHMTAAAAAQHANLHMTGAAVAQHADLARDRKITAQHSLSMTSRATSDCTDAELAAVRNNCRT